MFCWPRLLFVSLLQFLLESFPDWDTQVFHFVKQAHLVAACNLISSNKIHLHGEKQFPDHVLNALTSAHPSIVAAKSLEALLGTPFLGNANTVHMKNDEVRRQFHETDYSDIDEAIVQLETALLSPLAAPGISAVLGRSGKKCFSMLISTVACKLASPIPYKEARRRCWCTLA